MRIIRLIALCAGFLSVGLISAVLPVRAQDVAISVDFAPPPLPVYDQSPIPGPGYIWVPGYWMWSADVGWYWVPGTWVLPPAVGLLWTPGYWAYNDGAYAFYDGYWAPEVGFYGGIDYGAFRLSFTKHEMKYPKCAAEAAVHSGVASPLHQCASNHANRAVQQFIFDSRGCRQARRSGGGFQMRCRGWAAP